LDTLALFGFFAVSTMVVFYALENRNTWSILAGALLAMRRWKLAHTQTSQPENQTN
jgi:hypothetical protein